MTRDIDAVEDGPGARRDETARSRSASSPVHLWALAELFALCGFVIAQPLLEVTGKSPDFFLFRRADRLDILLLVVGVTVLPALGIWAGEVLAGLFHDSLRRYLHLAAVTGLLTLLAAEAIKKLTELAAPG